MNLLDFGTWAPVMSRVNKLLTTSFLRKWCVCLFVTSPKEDRLQIDHVETVDNVLMQGASGTGFSGSSVD